MPEWLMNHKLINYFLLGYFDGDGCISLNENKKILQIHIAGTEKFYFNLMKYLSSKGYPPVKKR